MGLWLTATAWRRQGLVGLAASGFLLLGACAASEPARDSPAPSPFLVKAADPAPETASQAPAAPPAPIVASAPAPLKPAPQKPAPQKPAPQKPTAATAKPAPAKPPAPAKAPVAAKAPAAPAPAQAFHQCRDQAMALDAQARGAATSAGYLAASEQAAKCDTDLGAQAATVPVQERMSLAGIAILDALKGGDVSAARRHLQRFETRFPGQDLALADGTSFVDTIALVLSGPEGEIRARHAQKTVSPAARRELLRARYWARN